MNKLLFKYLVCPKSGLKLDFSEDGNSNLLLKSCDGKYYYKISSGIPRFVEMDNYSKSFGLEWNIHNTTQYDGYSGFKLSEDRFFNETKWDRILEGQLILEAGCGSGRFTEHAVKTGADVVSFDCSNAVEANYKSNGNNKNLLIIQADIYNMPFKDNTFDKVFCFGVLQHTPDPKRAFFELVRVLKPGGHLAADVYAKTLTLWLLQTKYYVRPFTRNMNPEKLYKYVKIYINLMWPVAKIIRKIPKIGSSINWRLLIADFSQTLLKGADDKVLKEFAVLDTFDMLSPKYDYPQTLNTFKKWFFEAGLQEIDVHYGYNGIEGRGRKGSEK